jgi:hypothetical protein
MPPSVMHGARKRDLSDLHGKVQVIRHQAESMNSVAKSDCAFLQKEKKAIAIAVGGEDGLPAVAAQHDVVESAGKMDAGFACHGGRLAAR